MLVPLAEGGWGTQRGLDNEDAEAKAPPTTPAVTMATVEGVVNPFLVVVLANRAIKAFLKEENTRQSCQDRKIKVLYLCIIIDICAPVGLETANEFINQPIALELGLNDRLCACMQSLIYGLISHVTRCSLPANLCAHGTQLPSLKVPSDTQRTIYR